MLGARLGLAPLPSGLGKIILEDKRSKTIPSGFMKEVLPRLLFELSNELPLTESLGSTKLLNTL